MKRLSQPFLVLVVLTVMPSLVVGKSVLDWIEKPLDSIWRSMEEEPHPDILLESVRDHDGENDNHGDDDDYKLPDLEPQLTYLVEDDNPRHHYSPTAPPSAYPSIEVPQHMGSDDYNQEIYDDDDDFESSDDGVHDRSPTAGPVIVYRFYGGKANLSSRTTRFSPTAIPFLCIGPNVDHWKPVAQALSSRGFNVIACERVSHGESRDNQLNRHNFDATRESARVIRKLLNALRWSQVVLVGCDSESLVTIQAAMRLAPKRVVGLVLCGNLDATTKQIQDAHNYRQHPHHEHTQGYRGENSLIALTAATIARRKVAHFALDRFLVENMKCPVRIIWDGDGTTSARLPVASTKQETFMSATSPMRGGMDRYLGAIRCPIIGGGSAPHRRRPEQFAWVLSRFVEEQVAPTSIVCTRKEAVAPKARGGEQCNQTAAGLASNRRHVDGKRQGLRAIAEKFLSPFSFTVGGRMVATAIFYTVCLKVAIYQFENFRVGVNTVYAVRRRITGAILSMLSILTPSERAEETFSGTDSAKDAPETDETDSNGAEHSLEQDVKENSAPENDDEPSGDDGRYRPSFFLDNVIA